MVNGSQKAGAQMSAEFYNKRKFLAVSDLQDM
jgi:hypothetical protein